jgi:hypothetical protein
MTQNTNDADYMTDRRYLVVEFLRTPKTIKEMQAEFKVAYATIWRVIRDLKRQDLVVETPWRTGKEKCYVAKTNQEGMTVRIITPAGPQTIGWWASAISSPKDVPKVFNVSGALAQLWRFRAFSNTDTQKHLAGSTLPVECKAQLRESLEFLKRLEIAVEQMLLAPVWKEDVDIIEAFGEVDARVMVEIGEAFESRLGK